METPNWADSARFFFTFNAGHTPTGNPKRVLVFYDERANVVGTREEGYAGVPKWARERLRARTLYDGGRIDVTHAEYRAALKRGEA